MQDAVIIDANDVKKIISLFFGIQESQIIKSQYSWTITGITGEQISKLKQVQ